MSLKPKEVIIASIADGESRVSGVISTIGGVCSLAAYTSGIFELEAGNNTAGFAVLTGTIALIALNVKSVLRARSFRERDLELRGLTSRSKTSINTINQNQTVCASTTACHDNTTYVQRLSTYM